MTGRDFVGLGHPPVFRARRLCMVVDDAIEAAIPAVTRLPEAAELGQALERHTSILLATARALLRNEADARDLVQTTLEIATRRSSDLRDPTALRSWLFTIEIREAFRVRRRLARLVHFDPAIVDLGTAPGPEPDVIALRTALRRLPPRARAAVALHYLVGLPVTDVAQVMSISENTAKGHLKAGLARLREELQDDQ
ncbi:MAG: sigma-70 family RNA polymerase sigma factor [Candidatus Limnocylindrales bacterium]